MVIGRSPEEADLAREGGARSARPRPQKQAARSPAKGKPITLRLDREEDDDGSFYVAFVIDKPGEPANFTTFGSRDAAYCEKLARAYCAQMGYKVAKVVRTDSASETSGWDEVGLTRRGAGIAAAAGAGLGVLMSSGYLASVERKAFDRGFLDAQEGRESAPSMDGEQFFDSGGVGAEGLLPDWLTYLGIGAGTAGLASIVSELAQSPWAAKRVKSAYARGYEKGSGS